MHNVVVVIYVFRYFIYLRHHIISTKFLRQVPKSFYYNIFHFTYFLVRLVLFSRGVCTVGCLTRVLLKLGQKSFAPITFHPILAGNNAQSNPHAYQQSGTSGVTCQEYTPFLYSWRFRNIGKKRDELTLARCHSALIDGREPSEKQIRVCT